VIKKLVREVGGEEGTMSREEAGEVQDLQKDLLRRTAQLEQMQEVMLPPYSTST
jgi:hypothetical protein